MAGLLEQYGIKEVADVTFYDLTTKAPVLFLDTLKISTIEQTAEQVEARGGKGNPPLIIWDYGKEITVTLQDALFSPASMAIMFGDESGAANFTSASITRMRRIVVPAGGITTIPTGKKYYIPKSDGSIGLTAATTTDLTEDVIAYEEETISGAQGYKIEINHNTFPGTYKIVGETYSRNRKTGKDEYFQFVINQAKMSSENAITLEAEGDPSVFDMNMRVLRPADGSPMMELIQYELPDPVLETRSVQSAKTGLS